MGPFRTLIDFPGFQDGFWWGLLATGVVLGAGWVAVSIRRGSGTPLGLAGPAWVLVSLGLLGGWIGSNRTDVIPSGLLWGLLVLVIGGELADRTPNPIFIGMVFSVPGAFIVGLSREFPGPAWTKWVVVVVVAIGGPLAADLDRRTARLGLGPLLWLVAVAGVYWTVPDTERVRPLIGAAVPLAFCGWPKQWSRMGAGGIGAAVGVFAWVAAIEGRCLCPEKRCLCSEKRVSRKSAPYTVHPIVGGFIEAYFFKAQVVTISVLISRIENVEGDLGEIFRCRHDIENNGLVIGQGR